MIYIKSKKDVLNFSINNFNLKNLEYYKLLKYINPDLLNYIDKKIAIYNKFDPAHNILHAKSVIKNGLKYAEEWNKLNPTKKVDLNMVFTICALHDIGLSKDREKHNIYSRDFILKDKNLLRFFNKDQIKVIAEAAEDHRASLGSKPRSIYGEIVSEADRNHPKNLTEAIQRSVKYNLHHHPDFDDEKIISNVLENTYSGKHSKIFFDIPLVQKKKLEVKNLLDNKKGITLATKRLINKLRNNI